MEKYVLVEFPQDTSYFEDNEIGYPCCEAEDNGARYVSIEDYEKYFSTPPDPAQCHVVVQWPESQELLDDPKYEEYTEAVMDEKGLADFICPAYWVPLCYYQKPDEKEPRSPANYVSSFFYYMWNAWCESECEAVFGGMYRHFWEKWCAITTKNETVHGAAELFYAELSESNREKLVNRACEVYERGKRIK